METSRARTERPCGHPQPVEADGWEKAMSHKTHRNGNKRDWIVNLDRVGINRRE
jgi:hypothetical protein